MHKQVSLQRHQMTQFYHEPSYIFYYAMVAQISHGFPLSKGKGLYNTRLATLQEARPLQRAPCPSPRGKAFTKAHLSRTHCVMLYPQK